MIFEFTEMEALILEQAMKLEIKHIQDSLEKETDDDQKRMCQVEIDTLKPILKKLQFGM